MIKAIIFDVDGVLIDADYSRVEKYKKVCERAGIEYTEKMNELITSKQYSGIKDTAEKLKLSDRFIKLYSDGVDIDLSFYPTYKDTDKVLNKLSKKYRLIAYSAADKKITMDKLLYNDLEEYFEKVFCGNDGNSNYKEKPIKQAIKYLNLKPEEIAIVDDRVQAGIKIGNKLGLYTIRIKQGVHKYNEYVPNKIINNLGGLLKWKK